MSRADAFRTLAETPYDLLVVGGGITGAGVARDAAMRGLKTALVERDDFGSGTSSRSSRLIHGGVRYLEHGYFHLVFEASRERRTLLRIAPHLVRPLRFTWPVYQGARVPGWRLGAGLLLYDALALWRNVARHRRLTAAEVLAREPGLEPRGLTSGAAYFDAATDDSRLTLANALAAESAGRHGAQSRRAPGVRLRRRGTGDRRARPGHPHWHRGAGARGDHGQRDRPMGRHGPPARGRRRHSGHRAGQQGRASRPFPPNASATAAR